jgi:tetratricopeptide (TPR) repeat protein
LGKSLQTPDIASLVESSHNIKMDSFGPLPDVDRADELKRQSTSLIGAAIPKNRFIHRDEQQNDKGVDLSFEAIVAGKATNLRAMVQVKGTDSARLNADESFSLSVKTKNLNYLLSGPCPLYIVWLSTRDELRFAWARDEAKRLHQENPLWEEQDTVVLYFSRLLDADGWNDIHDRIQREGRFSRTQHDYFTRTGASESVVVGVNPETLEVLTPDKAYDTIINHGIAIVSSGYPLAIKHYSRLLTAKQSIEPAVLLALGFACYHLGEHFEARGHLARAIPNRIQLSEFDRYFLDSLVNECDLRFGRVDEEGFKAAQGKIEGAAPPFLALQMRLERIRWEHLAEHDTAKRCEKLDELRAVVSQLEQDPNASSSLKLQSAIVRLFAEIADSSIRYMEAVINMQARLGLKQNPITPSTMKALNAATAAEDKAHKDSQELLRRAVELEHPLLIGEAIVTQCMYRIGKITQLPALVRLVSGNVKKTPGELVSTIITQLEQAISIFRRAGATESVVRTTLILAQWHSTNGNQEKAKDLVESIIGLAHGMGYTHYVEEADALLSRRSALDGYHQSLAHPPDRDHIAIAMSDEEVAEFALFNLETAELPKEQFPVVHRVCLTMRDESRTRIEWCKHFRLCVGKTHAQILPTNYEIDPHWFARCMLIGNHTYTPSQDATEVTQRFKSLFCNTCTDRCPKRDG